jgi:hypothetical protein
MISFYLKYFFKDPISKYKFFCELLEIGLQCMNLVNFVGYVLGGGEGMDTTCNKFAFLGLNKFLKNPVLQGINLAAAALGTE